MSQGLKPIFVVTRNVRTEVRTYLRNKNRNVHGFLRIIHYTICWHILD